VTDYIPISILRYAAIVLALSIFTYLYYPHHLIRYFLEAYNNSASPLEATYERVLPDSLYGIAAQREVIHYVDRMSPAQEPIETISIFPGLRWRLHRQPATRFTSIVPLSAYTRNVPAYGAAWRREFLQDLAQTQPQFVIVSRSTQWWPFVGKTNDSAIASIPGFDSLLSANYALDTVIRGFALYRDRK
jgi:hypothetical protein